MKKLIPFLFLISCGSNEITTNWNLEFKTISECSNISVEKRKWTLYNTGDTFYLTTPTQKTFSFMNGIFWEDIDEDGEFRNIVSVGIYDTLRGYWNVSIPNNDCTVRNTVEGTK